MRFTGLSAGADLVGRRIRVSWSWQLDTGETLGSIPPVTLRRKQRDFEFPPPPAAPATDPYLVYADQSFPPQGTNLGQLDLGTTVDGASRTIRLAESALVTVDGGTREVLRKTTITTFDAHDEPVQRTVDVLDYGGSPDGLTPGIYYYYELANTGAPTGPGAPATTATALCGEAYGNGRALYGLLPEVHRAHDATARPADAGGDGIPEAAGRSGQLRRFIDVFGAGLDALRSSAEGLTSLHDVDHTDARLLERLAQWTAWDLSRTASIPLQRHEVKYAAALYRITGTIPGCRLWVKRLTGWDPQIHEFAANVFFTNDLGNPDDPNDHGSRTVDTTDASLLAARGTAQDRVHYTYDTGTGPDDWYAYDVVGIFVSPLASDTTADVVAKQGRILANTNLFLPFNLRAVVIVDAAGQSDTKTEALSLQTTTDQ
jgi:phage tail-like protein